MPSKDPLLSVRVPPALYQRLRNHWRYRTQFDHLSDDVRALLERALDIEEAEAERAEGGPPPTGG